MVNVEEICTELSSRQADSHICAVCGADYQDAYVPPCSFFWVKLCDSPVVGTGIFAILAKARLLGQGEFYVGVRDHYGRRRLSSPIRYQDYKLGRVVVITGAGYLSVAPASKTELLTRLRDAHQALTDG